MRCYEALVRIFVVQLKGEKIEVEKAMEKFYFAAWIF